MRLLSESYLYLMAISQILPSSLSSTWSNTSINLKVVRILVHDFNIYGFRISNLSIIKEKYIYISKSQ